MRRLIRYIYAREIDGPSHCTMRYSDSIFVAVRNNLWRQDFPAAISSACVYIYRIYSDELPRSALTFRFLGKLFEIFALCVLSDDLISYALVERLQRSNQRRRYRARQSDISADLFYTYTNFLELRYTRIFAYNKTITALISLSIRSTARHCTSVVLFATLFVYIQTRVNYLASN